MRNPFNYFRRATDEAKDSLKGNKLCLCFHTVPVVEWRQLWKISVMLVFIFIVAYAAFSQCPAGEDGQNGVDGIGPSTGSVEEKSPPKPTVYRISMEEGVELPAGTILNEEERKAVMRLNKLMAHWPKGLWLASHNGKLVMVKMGADGKPMGASK